MSNYKCGDVVRNGSVPIKDMISYHEKYCSKCKAIIYKDWDEKESEAIANEETMKIWLESRKVWVHKPPIKPVKK